jgi:acid phosphatase
MRSLIVSGILCSALAACAGAPKLSQAPPATPAPVALAGPPPNDNLNAVVWTQTAIEHDLIYREVYRNASEKLRAALDDPSWDALAAGDRKTSDVSNLKPAVIVDIDETVLDNSPYQARLVRDSKDYDRQAWAEWCSEEAAKPLPGALEFTQDAAKRGITVFYVSNRAEDLSKPTLANLRAAGFPIAANETVFLGFGTVVDGCQQAGSGKGCRRELIGRRDRVLMQVGDQLGDFVDPAANTPEGRIAAIKPYADWIGERWFVLPNPTYGAWEAALFGNDSKLSAEARREAKLKALRTK